MRLPGTRRHSTLPTIRIAALIAALALATLAAGCGGGGSASPTPANATVTGTIPTATPFATVPPATIVTATAGGGAEITYKVQPGDSLLAIASQFGSTVGAIQASNHLTGTDIYVGQQLVIPGATAPGGGSTSPVPSAPATPAATAAAGSTQDYVVQSGDTASGIAARFKTTLDALAAANGMTVSDLGSLQVGQRLQVPAP